MADTTFKIGGELEVNRLGFGAMRITKDRAEGVRVLRRAVELGANLIDTADIYGPETSEEIVAEALHPYEGLVIATKGGQIEVDGAPTPDCRPEHLRAACEASLARLRLDRIDLYQLHNPDPEIPLEEALGALIELRDEGKVRHVGVSNLYGVELEQALAAGAVSAQNAYSLSDRHSEPVLDAAERSGAAFMPYFPLAQGALAEDRGALGHTARKHGATPAQVALSWLLQRSRATFPIPCTTSVEHLEQNWGAQEVALDEGDLQLLAS